MVQKGHSVNGLWLKTINRNTTGEDDLLDSGISRRQAHLRGAIDVRFPVKRERPNVIVMHGSQVDDRTCSCTSSVSDSRWRTSHSVQ